jgi:hypothetical protein
MPSAHRIVAHLILLVIVIAVYVLLHEYVISNKTIDYVVMSVCGLLGGAILTNLVLGRKRSPKNAPPQNEHREITASGVSNRCPAVNVSPMNYKYDSWCNTSNGNIQRKFALSLHPDKNIDCPKLADSFIKYATSRCNNEFNGNKDGYDSNDLDRVNDLRLEYANQAGIEIDKASAMKTIGKTLKASVLNTAERFKPRSWNSYSNSESANIEKQAADLNRELNESTRVMDDGTVYIGMIGMSVPKDKEWEVTRVLQVDPSASYSDQLSPSARAHALEDAKNLAMRFNKDAEETRQYYFQKKKAESERNAFIKKVDNDVHARDVNDHVASYSKRHGQSQNIANMTPDQKEQIYNYERGYRRFLWLVDNKLKELDTTRLINHIPTNINDDDKAYRNWLAYAPNGNADAPRLLESWFDHWDKAQGFDEPQFDSVFEGLGHTIKSSAKEVANRISSIF